MCLVMFRLKVFKTMTMSMCFTQLGVPLFHTDNVNAIISPTKQCHENFYHSVESIVRRLLIPLLKMIQIKLICLLKHILNNPLSIKIAAFTINRNFFMWSN